MGTWNSGQAPRRNYEVVKTSRDNILYVSKEENIAGLGRAYVGEVIISGSTYNI